MSESKKCQDFSIADFPTEKLYEEILSRRKKLPSLKSQASMLDAQMKQMCHNLIYSDGISFTEQEIRSIRDRAESLKKEVRALERLSFHIRSSADLKKPDLSYKDCFKMFIEEIDGTFNPSFLLEYVSSKRGVEASNSVRVYVHRMLKDMLLEGVIVQVGHGKYCKAERK